MQPVQENSQHFARPDLEAQGSGQGKYTHLSSKELDEGVQQIHHLINVLQNKIDLFQMDFTPNTLEGWDKTFTCREGIVQSKDPAIKLNEFGTRILKDERSLGSTSNAEKALKSANSILNMHKHSLVNQIKQLESEQSVLASEIEKRTDHKRQIDYKNRSCRQKLKSWLSETFYFLKAIVKKAFFFLFRCF